MRTDSAARVANVVEMAWIRQKEYLEDLIRNDPTLSESDRADALRDLQQIQFLDDNRKALHKYLQDDSNRDVTETLNTVFQPFVIDQQPDSGQKSASRERSNEVPTADSLQVSAPSIVVQPQSPRPFGRSNAYPISGVDDAKRTESQAVAFSDATLVTANVAQAYLGSPIINASHLSWLFARFNAYGVTNEMVMAVVEALPNPTNTLEYQVEEGRTRLMMYHQVLQAVDENRALLESQLSGPSRDVLSHTQSLLGGKVPGFTSLPASSKAFAALLAVDYAKERSKGYTIEKTLDRSMRAEVLDKYRGSEKERLIKKLLKKKTFVRQEHQRQLSQRRRRIGENKRTAGMMLRDATRVHVAREAAVSLIPFLTRGRSLTR